MATIWTPFNAALIATLNQRYRLATAPSQFYLMLTEGAWDETADYATVLATQIAFANGYTAPIPLTANDDALHYPALNLASLSFDPVEIAASGANITYSRAVVTTNLNTLELYADFGGTQTITPGVPQTLTVTLNQGTATASVNQTP